MRFRMDDGVVLDPRKALAYWLEDHRFTGDAYVGLSSGEPDEHETLYLSSRGRYYVVRTHDFPDAQPTCEYVSPEDACAWLLMNNHKIPEDLSGFADEMSE